MGRGGRRDRCGARLAGLGGALVLGCAVALAVLLPGVTASPAARVASLAGAAGASGASSAGTTRYLLALGDSLAAGYQPTDGTSPPPDDPSDGLPDEGYPGGYAADVASHYGLRLVDLGCPGETTSSFTGTPAQAACATFYEGYLHVANQQAAAEAFLDAHRGQVALLTVDLGANDLDGCASATGVSFTCLVSGEADVVSQLPKELRTVTARLKKDDPAATAVGMNYYDPALGLAFSPGGKALTAEATGSVAALAAVNASLDGIDKAAHLLTADVAAAFDTYRATPLVRYGGRVLPRDVASICQLTWMCPLPGSSVKQDVHPRLAGYRTIASAFEAVLAAHHVHP